MEMKIFFKLSRYGFLPLLLTIALTGFFTGKQMTDLSGISPFYSRAMDLEEKYFLHANFRHDMGQLEYHRMLEAKISQVISKYKTGLKRTLRTQIPTTIIEVSRKYGYDPLFLTAVIVTESSFYNWAESRRGALGLMQIRPRTGLALASETRTRWKGKPTLYDPAANIALGAYYLDKLVKRFGDLSLALEAYNHGPSQVVRYLKKGYRPKRYSQKVFKHYQRIRSLPA